MKFMLAIMFTALLVSSCGDQKTSQLWKTEKSFEEGAVLKIVATTTMVRDLVEVLSGDKAEVYGLMGEGIDPHSYEERPSDIVALRSSDLIFYSGLHLEEKLQEKLEKMPKSHAVTAKLQKSELIIPEAKYDTYADPHVWGDPLLWLETIPHVVGILSQKDPQNAAYYEGRGDSYTAELIALDKWARARLNEIPREYRILVTSHDAFMYYARAYDFDVKAIDGLAPGDKGGPKKIKELVKFIQDSKLKMIFPESAVNSKGIMAIAKDAGVAVSERELFSDATGKRGKIETVNGEAYDVGTYIGMFKHNVNAIVEGLK